ncbi:MAG: branched-chain amino acid ABC transporter permease [Candidatus Bathyarchaeota archaeon]|nr:branched-chain amino acid ABC transporter permease [Candidatus Bathyarchaeota archaeon]
MIDLLGLTVSQASGLSQLIIDIAMYFGAFVIVAMALNFQYGNAGVPNMGCAVQVIAGGFTVSAITTRVTFMIVKAAGLPLMPYASDYDWVYNNPHNVAVVTNPFIETHTMLGISLLLFSLALALVLGSAIGYIISLPAIRLRSTYLMITLITMADASQIFGRNIPAICGGTLGVFVPNVFAWYLGNRGIILAVVTLLIGIIAFFIFRTMLNSPYGRLMRAIRENDGTVESVGKNVVGIRRNILMFASGITALTGVMWAFYASYVVDNLFMRADWTYWPWLMLILGGPGNNAGTFLGCALIIALRRIILISKWSLEQYLFFPIAYVENILLGVLLIAVIIFRPRGLIPEKLLYIPGINYRKMVTGEAQVDLGDSAMPKAETEGGEPE